MNEFYLHPAAWWFIAGVLLMLLELVLPGLVVFFFGLAGISTSVALLFFDFSFESQLLIFVVMSFFYLLVIRRWVKKHYFNDQLHAHIPLEDEVIGKRVKALEALHPNKAGKVEFKGAVWTAISTTPALSGDELIVTGTEGIKLFVTSINQ